MLVYNCIKRACITADQLGGGKMLWLVGLALLIAIAAAVIVSLFCDADLTTVLCELAGHKSNIRTFKTFKLERIMFQTFCRMPWC